MSLKVQIATDGEHVVTQIKKNELKNLEVAMVIRELERVKLELLEIEFEREFEFEDPDGGED